VATRVLLVEDNAVYRSSLELLLGLQSGLEVVGAVGTGDEAAEAARELGADVVVMDYRLPGLDGAAARALCDRDALMLACLPGVSTAQELTEVSGRGVGMDAVKRTVEALGGAIDVESAPGRGSRR